MKQPKISDSDILDFIGRKDGTTYKEMEEWSGYSRISLIKKMGRFLENKQISKKEPIPLVRFIRTRNG